MTDEIDDEEFFDWYFQFKPYEVFEHTPPMKLSPDLARLWDVALTEYDDFNEAIDALEDLAWKDKEHGAV